MKRENIQHTEGAVFQSGKGLVALAIPFLLLVGVLLVSCNDQPIDPDTGHAVRMDTTVVVQHDTIVINSRDTVIETRVDTVIVEHRDTIKVETVKRDTIRDTIEVIKTRIDTIKVPTNATRFRRAILRFEARNTAEPNGGVEAVEINVTDWLQYKVIDSNDNVRGIGLSMSLAMPTAYNDFAIGSNQIVADNPYSLRGISLFIPVFRIGANVPPFDEVLLNQHPFSDILVGSNQGGMMITTRQGDRSELQQFWTGQVREVQNPTGVDRFENEGTLTLKSINRATRRITLQVQARFFLTMEFGGRNVTQPFNLGLEIDLGY